MILCMPSAPTPSFPNTSQDKSNSNTVATAGFFQDEVEPKFGFLAANTYIKFHVFFGELLL